MKSNNNTISELQCKSNKSYLNNPHRKRVLELLLTGRRLTVVQATKELNIPDFRSHIRYIRKAGIDVCSVWVNSGFSRFKIYFIRK